VVAVNPSGVVLVLAGAWVLCQVLGGNALRRLNISGPATPAPQPTAPGGPGGHSGLDGGGSSGGGAGGGGGGSF
jgi:hypothetical protein